ncbi:MAG: AcrR family transcriptional regulator [Maribacter sp.]|jgi:AcrR family transcriptional regulator
MRPQLVIESDLLNSLMEVLRTKGYDGASLNELASNSGLKKASLYHRYPGGKKEVALAVLKYVDEWVNTHIIAILADTTIDKNKRLHKIIDNINLIYGEGSKACILRALSTDSGIQLFSEQLKDSMSQWINGFTLFGMELGQPKSTAENNAYKVLTLVQGSLVVSKTFNNNKAFLNALAEIRMMYI